MYIKTAYHDEPTFANSKVVTSLFQNQFKSTLGDRFKQCVEFKSAKASLLDKYPTHFAFMELGKLAIDYSDGIIEAGEDVNKELLSYAKATGKPLLDYPGPDYAAADKDFYNKIIGLYEIQNILRRNSVPCCYGTGYILFRFYRCHRLFHL